jgi:hypothetical protein
MCCKLALTYYVLSSRTTHVLAAPVPGTPAQLLHGGLCTLPCPCVCDVPQRRGRVRVSLLCLYAMKRSLGSACDVVYLSAGVGCVFAVPQRRQRRGRVRVSLLCLYSIERSLGSACDAVYLSAGVGCVFDVPQRRGRVRVSLLCLYATKRFLGSVCDVVYLSAGSGCVCPFSACMQSRNRRSSFERLFFLLDVLHFSCNVEMTSTDLSPFNGACKHVQCCVHSCKTTNKSDTGISGSSNHIVV